MNRILATLVLTCVLAVSAFAGEIPTCGCKALSADPTVGAPPAPEIGDVPTIDATVTSETEPNLLTTVLLTFLSW